MQLAARHQPRCHPGMEKPARAIHRARGQQALLPHKRVGRGVRRSPASRCRKAAAGISIDSPDTRHYWSTAEVGYRHLLAISGAPFGRLQAAAGSGSGQAQPSLDEAGWLRDVDRVLDCAAQNLSVFSHASLRSGGVDPTEGARARARCPPNRRTSRAILVGHLLRCSGSTGRRETGNLATGSVHDSGHQIHPSSVGSPQPKGAGGRSHSRRR